MNYHNQIKSLKSKYGSNPATAQCLKDTLTIFKAYVDEINSLLGITSEPDKPTTSQPRTPIEQVETLQATGRHTQARRLSSKLLQIYQEILEKCDSDRDRQELKACFAQALQTAM